MWSELQAHQKTLPPLTALFEDDAQRFDTLHLKTSDFIYDFSRQQITAETLALLCSLLEKQGFEEKRAALFNGEGLNVTEKRGVFHTGLRDKGSTDPRAGEIAGALQKMKTLSQSIIEDEGVTDVLAVGVGGSHLGPALVCDALGFMPKTRLNVHFVSNIDGHTIESLLAGLNPKTTLVLLASKSFGTQEVKLNADVFKGWLDNPAQQMLAVTSNAEAATAYGVAEDNILPMWDWVGGRFSVWSAIGFPICLQYGFKVFEDLLSGAHAMDTHFKDTPLAKNLPVLMAMIGIWNINVCGRNALAVLPYDERLRMLPPYLQQLEMESNGKSVSVEGKPIDYQTAPSVFGEVGTCGQHAFYQLLHQGPRIIPAEFIGFKTPNHSLENHHNTMLANMLAQADALAFGHSNTAQPHRNFEGNRPSSTLIFNALTPHTLGQLMAAWEHKIFTQGVVWNINSFDQFGVELGKTLSQSVLGVLTGRSAIDDSDRKVSRPTQALLDILSA